MRNILFIFMVSFCCFSCRKGALPDPVYYSRIVVNNLGFPGASTIDVRFGDKVLGSVNANDKGTFNIVSDSARLGVYKAGTDSLLADTLLQMKPNSGVALRFGYSPNLGFSSFLSSAGVSTDTVAFQLLNNLGDFYKKYTSITAHLQYLDYSIGWLAETGYTIPGFMHVKLSQQFRMPYLTPEGYLQNYVLALEDATTGQWIIQPGSGVEWTVLTQINGGQTAIFVLSDNNGDVINTDIEY